VKAGLHLLMRKLEPPQVRHKRLWPMSHRERNIDPIPPQQGLDLALHSPTVANQPPTLTNNFPV
jgi:hypothetical protein